MFKEIFEESITSKGNNEARTPKELPQEYKNMVRYIPSGAQIIAELDEKSLKLKIITSLSTPTAYTDFVRNHDKDLKRNTEKFVKDVEAVINLKKAIHGAYIFISGGDGYIDYTQSLELIVNSKTEGKKLALLYEALSFYIGRKAPMR